MSSSGGGHGDFHAVPDDFDLEDTEIVDTDAPIDNSQTSGLKSDSHYYFCLWCEELFKGERGYKVHLKRSRGDEHHPESASVEDRNYTLVPADSKGMPFVSKDEISERLNLASASATFVDTSPESAEYEIPDADPQEQVAALIQQEPALFHDPGTVCDLLGITRHQFFEGRNLYRLRIEDGEESAV